MKEKAVSIIFLAVMLAIPITLFSIADYNDKHPKASDFNFTETITLVCKDTTTIITDPNDIEDIIFAITDGLDPIKHRTSFPFEIELIFEGNGKSISAFPARDGWDVIGISGGNFINLNFYYRHQTMLKNVIKKYVEYDGFLN